MKNIKGLVLAAALAAGCLSLGATQAQAARVRIAFGGPVAVVPPCPGPGYVWIAGYWNGGVWVPGYWNFAGPAVRFGVGPVVVGHFGRGFDRGPVRFRR